MNTASKSTPAAHPHLAQTAQWRQLPALQQPEWPDAAAVQAVRGRLAEVPPLVFDGEVVALTQQLATAQQRKSFVLMGGDCAETFAESTAARIQARIKTLLQMSVVLTYGARLPVIKIGRMAGQFAKPRSQSTETRAGVTLPAYRGDAVNGFAFTEAARTPNPDRLLQAYHVSASTLNLMRAFAQGGFADLRKVHEWNQGFVSTKAYEEYEQLAAEIDRAIGFMKACGANFEAFRTVDLYASHEALLLDYEIPLTRTIPGTGELYNASAHFHWIGERTRGLDTAHVHYLSGISNPIGCKVSTKTTPAEAIELARILNPNNIPGRLTFISRMGAEHVTQSLPQLITAVHEAGFEPLWVCDPMHGNTFTSASGYKTRRFDDVIAEVRGFFAVHQELGTWPGGIHVELTGDDVTECLGGTDHIDDAKLSERYETVCDPRMNHQQSLELAFLVAKMLQNKR